jgi:hypothetical protein
MFVSGKYGAGSWVRLSVEFDRYVNAVGPDLARTDLVDQQKVQPFYAVGHAWQEATLFPSLFGGQFAF